jgi:hypothetical protein
MQIGLNRAFVVAAVATFGVCSSIGWSPDTGLSLSVDSAQARVGRPATPMSYAGVARRTTRRTVVGGAAVGAAATGAYYGRRCGYYPYPPCY